MRPDLDALAAEVVRTLATALAPVQATLAAVQDQVKGFEARWSDLGALRERVAVVESKVDQQGEPGKDGIAGAPGLPGPPGPSGERGEKGLDGLLGAAGDRGLEGPEGKPGRDGRDGLAGMTGEKGLNGTDGRHGLDGKDGLSFDDFEELYDGERTFTHRYRQGDRVKEFVWKMPLELYRGVYTEGKTYERGDGATFGGSEWHANETTTTKPGDGSKSWTLKVKRGRDGKDGAAGADGKPGRDLTEKAAWQR